MSGPIRDIVDRILDRGDTIKNALTKSAGYADDARSSTSRATQDLGLVLNRLKVLRAQAEDGSRAEEDFQRAIDDVRGLQDKLDLLHSDLVDARERLKSVRLFVQSPLTELQLQKEGE